MEMDSTFEEEDLFFIKVNKSGMDSKGAGSDKGGEANVPSDKDGIISDTNNPVVSSGMKDKDEAVFRESRNRGMNSNSYGAKRVKGEGLNRDPNAQYTPAKYGSDYNCSIPSGGKMETSLAIVPYGGKVMNEVIHGFSGLGLKRNAEDDLEVVEVKYKKLNEVNSIPKQAISVYADNLRKTKARARRNTKKRVKAMGKEMVEEGIYAEDNKIKLASINSEEAEFTFKAKRGKRRMNISEGVGGWPLTATKSS